MNQQSKTILFQGDSITDGNRGRNDDPNHILGNGYVFILAGKLGFELAEERPHFINRGISGNSVADLYGRWNEDAISLKPDLISILIGVNDAWRIVGDLSGRITDRFERAYRHLLEETVEVMPNTGLVICEPFVLKTGVTAEKWELWRNRLDDYSGIARRLSQEFNAVYVPLQAGFDKAASGTDAAYWLWDGVHPTAAGHELIAREWLSVVQNSPLAIR
jgi:lysophospholipase L1-like esterase